MKGVSAKGGSDEDSGREEESGRESSHLLRECRNDHEQSVERWMVKGHSGEVSVRSWIEVRNLLLDCREKVILVIK